MKLHLKDPTSILWDSIQRIGELKTQSREGSWKFRDGIELFINPPAKCPDCEEWIPTNRIWLVDNTHWILLKCWGLDGSPIWWGYNEEEEDDENWSDPDYRIIHPHVKYNGHICTQGTAKSASSALFVCIAPGNHYFNTEMWFWQWGHDCPKVEKVNCAWCSRRGIDSSYQGYGNNRLCSNRCIDFAYDFRCSRCFAETGIYDNINITDHLCQTCYLADTTPCSFCANRAWNYNVRHTVEGNPLCVDCRPNHQATCIHCGNNKPHSELDANMICMLCLRNRATGSPNECLCTSCRENRGERRCFDCGDWCNENELDEEGYCAGCIEE